jgi:hypothetical protein
MTVAFNIKKNIIIKPKLLEVLKGLGFAYVDFLIIFIIISSLDDANCLCASEKEIAKLLYISPRTVIRTMIKLKDFGVIKIRSRYDFTFFLKNLEDLEKTLDSVAKV